MIPAFFRFPTSLFVDPALSARLSPGLAGSRRVSPPHNLTASPQSHFAAQKARFGPKSLDSLMAKNPGYDQGL